MKRQGGCVGALLPRAHGHAVPLGFALAALAGGCPVLFVAPTGAACWAPPATALRLLTTNAFFMCTRCGASSALAARRCHVEAALAVEQALARLGHHVARLLRQARLSDGDGRICATPEGSEDLSGSTASFSDAPISTRRSSSTRAAGAVLLHA